MQLFVVIGFDGQDSEAPARRAATRPSHLEYGKPFVESGTIKYGGPLLNKDGNMIGSMMVIESSSEEALRAEFLANEPYVTQGVWETFTIYPFQLAPHFA